MDLFKIKEKPSFKFFQQRSFSLNLKQIHTPRNKLITGSKLKFKTITERPIDHSFDMKEYMALDSSKL